MRLSSKIFVALAVLAGSIFGFSPDASAHLRTGMVAAVTGDVFWTGAIAPTLTPAGVAALGDACPVAAPGTTPVGLPLNIPGQPQMEQDTCFTFGGVVIQAVGAYEQITGGADKLILDFDCGANGISTVGAGLLGTFQGMFDCAEDDTDLGGGARDVTGAHGTFQGLSRDTTIAFLGEICDDVAAADARDLGTADLAPDGTCVGAVNIDPDGNAATAPVFAVTSGVKHTVACKGEVIPDLTPASFIDTASSKSGTFVMPTDGIPDSVLHATVALECVIA